MKHIHDRGIVVVVTPDEKERVYVSGIMRGMGYRVEHAGYGNLLDVSKRTKSALIIMDADLAMAPDAMSIVDEIYSDDATRGTPMILLTPASGSYYTYGGYEMSQWAKSLAEKRIPTFRKGYTEEHLAWFVDHYFEALSRG